MFFGAISELKMKRLFMLVITYASIWNLFLLDVFHAAAIETPGVQTTNSDAKIDDYRVPYTNIKKRSSAAFKRLPGWTVYYGKRSYTSSPIDETDEVREKTEREINLLKVITNTKDSEENNMPFDLDTHQKMGNGFMNSEIKRDNLKRLQSWSTTYGKRSVSLDLDVNDNELNVSEDDSSEEAAFEQKDDSIHSMEGQWQQYNNKDESSSQDVNKIASQSAAEDGKRESGDENNEKRGHQWGIAYGKRPSGWGATYGKRVSGWSATYGKRAPGWGATYGKRAPGWSATYGKRAPGWSASYGKRAPGWGATYGKRAPGWSTTYGKRAPGWGATYGKRAPGWGATFGKRIAGWDATYGKRAPGWGATYGKRAPGWGATYGKRAPGWGATYGKRAPGWSATYGKRIAGWGATYGKRAPGWGATYGKRISGWGATYGKRVPGWRVTYGKRSNAWNDLYGKRMPGWYATYGKRYIEPEGTEPLNLTDANGDSQEESMQTLNRTQ